MYSNMPQSKSMERYIDYLINTIAPLINLTSPTPICVQ